LIKCCCGLVNASVVYAVFAVVAAATIIIIILLLLLVLLLIVNLQRTTLYAAHGEGRPLRSLSVVAFIVVFIVVVVVDELRPIGIYFMHKKLKLKLN